MSVPERGPEPFRLLFVCTGNTCRSPLAAAVARRELAEVPPETAEVASAGTAALEGVPASGGALRAARRAGFDLSGHRSTPLTGREVERADLILAMSPGHVARVEELGGEGRVHLLRDFAAGEEESSEGSVPDPFGGPDEVYEETLAVLKDLVTKSIRRLEPILSS